VKRYLIAVISSVVMCAQAQMATNAPAFIPASTNLLRAYALTIVDTISGGVSGASGGKEFYSVPYPYRDGNDVRMAYVSSAQAITFQAVPTNTLNAFANYNGTVTNMYGGTVGVNLFYGGTNFVLQKTSTGYKVPDYAKHPKLNLAYLIPFPVGNASWAHLEQYDSNGNIVNWFDLSDYLHDGLLWLGQYMTDVPSTKLFLSYNDGSQAIYDMPSGKQIPQVSVSDTGFSSSVDGVRDVQDPTNIVYAATDEIIHAAYSKSLNTSITFAPGQSRYPLAVYIIDLPTFAANPQATWSKVDPYSGPIAFAGAANTDYFIRFEYQPASSLPVQYGKAGVAVGSP